MNKVYELNKSDDYSHFIEIYSDLDNSFIYKYWEWKIIDLNTYIPIKFYLYKNDQGKKNFKSDFFNLYGLMILSEKAWNVLKDILQNKGQLLEIETDSKRKKFYGFYPNTNPYDLSIINLDKSDWRQAGKGKIFYKIALKNNYPKEEYIFVLKEESMKIYVTDKFKKLVEEHDLKGFDFSHEIEIKD